MKCTSQMSTVKVLHVIARMNVGGTAKYVSDLVSNIPGSVLATGFVQTTEIEDSVINGLQVHRVPHLGRKISPYRDFRSLLELKALVRELQPDIIHTHTFKAGLIGRLVSGRHKHVHTFHGHLFGDQSFSSTEKKIIILIEKFLANKTDLLISVGEKVGKELRKVGIGPDKNWVSIPPGITPLHLVDKGRARELLGLTSEGLLIGWMARMTEVKNPHLMLKIASKLPATEFVMAGGGNLLEEIKRKAPQNVKVIGWTDPSLFWSAVDVCISTSDNEGMPIALIEAQMAGIPVVATDVGSNCELIVHGLTGIITSKNVDDLVRETAKMVAYEKDREIMKAAAKIWANDKFGLEKMLTRYQIIYDNLFVKK